MDEADGALLTPDSYDVLIDGTSVGPLKNVQIDKRDSWSRSNKNSNKKSEGVVSVILSCNNRLMGRDLQVLFRNGITDIDGNQVSVGA